MRLQSLIFAISLLLATVSAYGRLNETPEQCAKRYGPPVKKEEQGKIRIQTFKKSGFVVKVYFVEKKEMFFAYTRAVAIMYSKPTDSGVQNKALLDVEIKKFLDVNSQGEEWTEVDLLKKAANEDPGPKQEELIKKAGQFLLWTRKGGETAHYLRTTNQFIIRSTKDVSLPKQKEPTKEPDYLEGF